MLEELDCELRRASQTADRIGALCALDGNFEPVVEELVAQVGRVQAVLTSYGSQVPQEAAAELRELANKVFGITVAAEANKQLVSVELESITQRERVRRVYARPAG